MTLADTSRAQLRHIAESTWGTTPASALTDLRITGESLTYSIGTVQSDEIRSDRQVPDVVQTSFAPEGAFNFEWSYAEYDAFLEGAFQSDWVTGSHTGAGAADDFKFDSSAQTITGQSGDFTGVVPGVYVKVTGAASNNNGTHEVASATDTVITLVAGSLGTTEDSIAATVAWAFLRNGTTAKSFTLEKEFTDVTQFISFTGMRVEGFSLDVQSEQLITRSFDFQGKAAAIAATTVGTGGPTASQTNDVMNASVNVGNVQEGGTAIAGIQALSLAVANNLRGQTEVGQTARAGVGSGRCVVTGDLTAYFQDETLYSKYLDNTASSMHFRTTDAAGNQYLFTLPRVKYSDGDVVAGGPDQDVLVNLSYQAILDSTTGTTIQIDRFAA